VAFKRFILTDRGGAYICLSSVDAMWPVGATKRAWACSTGFAGVKALLLSALSSWTMRVDVDEKATPSFLVLSVRICLCAVLLSLSRVSASAEASCVDSSPSDALPSSSWSRRLRKTFLLLDALNVGPWCVRSMLCMLVVRKEKEKERVKSLPVVTFACEEPRHSTFLPSFSNISLSDAGSNYVTSQNGSH
jgi:hypothetical protein